MTQKIRPCLWFDTEAEEAAEFYVSVFKNSRVLEVAHYGEAGPGPEGTVMVVSFELDGVHGHEKVPAGGQMRSLLVARKSTRWWPAEVPTPH